VQDRSLDSKTYTAALAAVAAQRAAAAAVRVRCGECEACLDAARVRGRAKPEPQGAGRSARSARAMQQLMPPCVHCHAHTCILRVCVVAHADKSFISHSLVYQGCDWLRV